MTCHLAERFACLPTLLVKRLAFGHISGFEPVGCLYIHRLVEQLVALACGDITDRGETVGMVRSLFLHRVLGNHIQFRRHLVAVISLKVVVERLAVAGN